MRAELERELKLAPPPGLDLSALGGETIASRTFDSTYYDTGARDLLQRGVTLRRRVEGDRAAWQLKLPSGGARFELELDGGDAPPDEALKLLVALTRGASVRPVARLRTQRETTRLHRDGVHVADIVVDAVTVFDGDELVATFDELEVELADGDEHDLQRLDRALRAAGATESPGSSKLVRAIGKPDPPPPATDDSPGAILRAGLRAQREELVRRDPGTRTGLDPEDLHQFRVATRRLRAFLRSGRELVGREWADELRAELAWLGGLLGSVRDRDVLIERFRGESEELEAADREALRTLFVALDREREAGRQALLTGLESDRYLALLDRLDAEPPTAESKLTLTRIWRHEHRRARKAVAGLDESPADAELHGSRVRVKRARYAAELALPELGKKGALYVDAAKEFQDIVGAHQDAVVGEDLLRRLAPELPGAALAMGRLVDRERARRAVARVVWRDAWERLDRRAKALGA